MSGGAKRFGTWLRLMLGHSPQLQLRRLSTFAEYREYEHAMHAEYALRRDLESRLMSGAGGEFNVNGFCYVCRRRTRFIVNYDYAYPVDGRLITHVLAPEYHGDPINANGILCFQHFGWDLFDRMRVLGFQSAEMLVFWSAELGYLGTEQSVMVAVK